MERRLAVVLAGLLFLSSAMFVADVKLFHGTTAAPESTRQRRAQPQAAGPVQGRDKIAEDLATGVYYVAQLPLVPITRPL
jgi:hypothetical protein